MPERLNSLFFWVPSTLLGRSSVGARVRLRNGATILHSSWPITLTAMVLNDGSVVHGGPLRPRARIVQVAGSARASVCVCGGLACVERGGA